MEVDRANIIEKVDSERGALGSKDIVENDTVVDTLVASESANIIWNLGSLVNREK